MDYALVGLAVLLLAGQLTINKVFQVGSGESLRSGVIFNIVMGGVTALFFFIVNGFRLDISAYSVIMATIMTACCGAYMVISFKLMALGGVAMYSLFLMLGGMVLPYIYGVAALGERLTLPRTVGLILICASMVFTAGAGKKGGAKVAVLCAAVFLLNGVVSVVSKLHQIESAYRAVGTTDFVILTGIIKAVLFALMLPFLKRAPGEKSAFTPNALTVITLSAVVGGVSYLLQLMGAKNLPATVLYPMVTGGTVVMTALMGFLFFKEKPGRLGAVGIGLCFIATFMFL